jgi:predicted N-acetyltransferase YhbS
MIIRQEIESDYSITENVIKEAFKDAEHSDNDEHFLVHRLRQSNEFIPQLSIVAEIDNRIVGHILFSKILIIGDNEFESIALAPVSVLPEYQKRGIGSKLIQEGLLKTKMLGFDSVIVLGHKDYYPKFGFEKASKWSIQCPFDVPDDAFMAIELIKDSLIGKSGIVKYSKEFGL